MWKTNKFDRARDCPKFRENPTVNPATNRKINPQSPAYKWLTKKCAQTGFGNFAEYIQSLGNAPITKIIDSVESHQNGVFLKDLKTAFLKGYKGATGKQLNEMILDLGVRKFKFSVFGPIAKRLERLVVPEVAEEEIEAEEIQEKNFCNIPEVKRVKRTGKFKALPHQERVRNFMRDNDRMLLYHGLGSGKTCSSSLVIDDYIKRNRNNLVYFLSPGGLRSNFVTEYCAFCPVDKREDIQNKDYKSFRFFSTDDSSLRRKLPKKFENCLVVIDEAQSVIDSVKESKGKASEEVEEESDESTKNLVLLFNRLTKNFSNVKLLLLSGTPMADNLQQYYNCIKLLKPEDSPDTFDDFSSLFETVNEAIVPKEGDQETVDSLFSDCISYYASSQESLPIRLDQQVDVEMSSESVIGSMISAVMEKELRTNRIPLESMITKLVRAGYTRKNAAKIAAFRKTRAAKRSFSCGLSNIVYPDQLEAFISSQSEDNEEEMEEEIDNIEVQDMGDVDNEDKNVKLLNKFPNLETFYRKYAPKIGKLVEILKSETGKQAVYCPFKVKYGVQLISKVLEREGISNKIYSGDESHPIRSKILNLYNSPENDDGSKLQVLLFTDAAGEGITLLTVRGIHIFNENIFKSQTDQVIGRAIRYMSHARLPEEERTVTVYRYRLMVDEISPDEENFQRAAAREVKMNTLKRKVHTEWCIERQGY